MSPHTSSHHAGRKPQPKHKREPVAIVGGATVLVSAAALIGFDLNPEVALAIIGGFVGVGTAYARSRVTPVE